MIVFFFGKSDRFFFLGRVCVCLFGRLCVCVCFFFFFLKSECCFLENWSFSFFGNGGKRSFFWVKSDRFFCVEKWSFFGWWKSDRFFFWEK